MPGRERGVGEVVFMWSPLWGIIGNDTASDDKKFSKQKKDGACCCSSTQNSTNYFNDDDNLHLAPTLKETSPITIQASNKA